MDPVPQGPVARLEGDTLPGNRLRPERLDLECLCVQAVGAPHDPRLEGKNDDRGLEPRIETDDLAWLDDQAGLLEGLPDRGLGDGLIDLEEAARLGPPAPAGLDSAPKQNDLAGIVHRDRRDDQPRVDVSNVAARAAGESIAIFPVNGAELKRAPTPGAEVQRRCEPGRNAGTGGDVGRAGVRATIEACAGAGRVGHARITASEAAMSATRPMMLTATQASRNAPRLGLTGIHAHAERQMRTVASAVVMTSRGAPTMTQTLMSGLPSGTPSSRAVIAMNPAMRTGTDRRTYCFWSGVGAVSGTDRAGSPWRLGGSVDGAGVVTGWRSRTGMPASQRSSSVAGMQAARQGPPVSDR